MKIERQIDECLCSNVHSVYNNNLSREKSEIEWKSKIDKWTSKVSKERHKLHAECNEHVEEINHVKRHGCKARKIQHGNQRNRDG